MLLGSGALRDHIIRLRQRRFDGGAAPGIDFFDLFLDGSPVVGLCQFHLPIILIIKCQNTYIIRVL